ncbi:uncharacterized protein LOC111714991 isoform X2 [Eurytemora carolleeae]|uniref:uncharacterized protein LOC111714991 isoform X2 n=1 Tax=Eurytemora carolleeae TaxID=1294199 RepID=UPI000C76D7F8|nr:uncharacterized protein LOC111714991 isoform X2 [Eurytemora carolleeae]|eukprot:XP_023345988.1 uncharacterized protein LOC111714991 isoform X2 [Eurytemora affinis]
MDENQNGSENRMDCVNYVFQSIAAGNTQAVRQYLSSGGDVNMCENNTKNSLLHFAVLHDSYTTAVLLLKSGADVNLENSCGLTAMQLARKMGNREGFIVVIQLSVRKRRQEIELKQKETLIKENMENKHNRSVNPSISRLLKINSFNIEKARKLVKNLEEERERAEKLLQSLEHQHFVLKGQLFTEDETKEKNVQISNTVLSPESIRCIICWEPPSSHIYQCSQVK